MRKTTEYNTENRLTVDIEGLMAMLSCGTVTARKISVFQEFTLGNPKILC